MLHSVRILFTSLLSTQQHTATANTDKKQQWQEARPLQMDHVSTWFCAEPT